MAFEINYGAKEQVVVDQIADYVNRATKQGKRVLWLVSGGSNTKIAVEVAKKIIRQNLVSVAQVDERYGEIGHNDSNWQHLLGAGFLFDSRQLYPVLQGKPFRETVEDYEETLNRLFIENDYIVGQFGIGEDGHTAGILPGSPAAIEDTKLVYGYDGPDYRRITVTPKAITRISKAFTYAGKGKEDAIQRLKSSHSISGQPAQILKFIKSSSVYTN